MALGPFVIALPRLFLLLGLAAAWFVAYGVERRSGGSLEKPLWWSLVVGLPAARLGFVLTHLSDYRAQPWEALYFWQGGFMPLRSEERRVGKESRYGKTREDEKRQR